MLYDPDTANHLKPWLIKTLEPICDAEPGALADYILALLKHSAPESELRKELVEQLEEFLEKECSSFVDNLFIALRSKSYIPYSDIPVPSNSSSAAVPSSSGPSDAGIPIPLDGLLNPTVRSPERGRKRGADDDYDSSGPSKGARLNQDGQFSRHGRGGSWAGRGERGGRMNLSGRADFMDGGMSGMDMGMGMNMNGRNGHNYRPPDQRRGICRDYHNNGYCARGAFCKYSHGDDAVIPSQIFPMGNGMPFMPMMGPGGMNFRMGNVQDGQYDPHERMDMRPMGGMGGGRGQNGRPTVLPRPGDGNAPMGQNPGELPVIQDLTPQVPIQDVSPHNNGEGFRQQPRPAMEGVPPMNNVNNHAPPPAPMQMAESSQPQRPFTNGRGGGRGRGRGNFGGDAQSFRPERRNDKTLVVEKIPEEKLSLGAVNDWFSKFGTVTNVAVDAASSKALVSFADHEDAHKAWKSEEAVFGNRFVRVFWHRPMEGHGQAGQRALAASAPLVAQRGVHPAPSTAPSEGSTAPRIPTAPAPPVSRTPSASSSAAASLAAKQKLLQQQIEEQKALMAKLPSASPTEKKEIMARLRKLNEEMKPSPASTASTSHTSPPTASSSVPTKRSAPSTPHTDDHERLERERLDKELDTPHVETGEGEEESTEELKAKLEKLKAEAASLGIPVADGAPPPSTAYRPYRGRGRGARGPFYRGAMRGGPPRTSMKLDNRPKKLVVKGAPQEALQSVRDWYETTGQVDSVETGGDGDILVSFRTRAAAEQGFAKGSHIALVGPVQVSWHSGQSSGTFVRAPSASPAAPPAPEAKDAMVSASDVPDTSADTAMDTQMHAPEDVEVGGWGGDDDGFGMM